MNREIKFRAWDKKAFCMMEVVTIDFDQQSVSIRDHEAFYYESLANAELMQYTGLKDKNGVEIYEGDIVRVTFGEHSTLNEYSEWIGKIFFNYGSFDIDGEWCVALNSLGDTTFEVIGNIYENPELLEIK